MVTIRFDAANTINNFNMFYVPASSGSPAFFLSFAISNFLSDERSTKRGSGSKTVRRDALGQCFDFSRVSLENLNLFVCCPKKS